MRRSEMSTLFSTICRVIGPGRGTHLVNAWTSDSAVLAPLGRQPPPELADEVLGRPVVVRQVPGGEAGVVVGQHGVDGRRRINAAVGAGHLPHAVEDAADGQAINETEAGFLWQCHGRRSLNHGGIG